MTKHEIIQLKQEAIIDYTPLDVEIDRIVTNVSKYNFEMPPLNDDDNKALKAIIASARKDLKAISDKRIAIRREFEKPYTELHEHIKTNLESVVMEKIDKGAKLVKEYEDGKLKDKVQGIKDYFEENNNHKFIRFEQLNLNIVNSASDKKLKEEVDLFLQRINNDLLVIDTQANNDRVLAKYFDNLDLSLSITQVNAEIERENELQALRERNDTKSSVTKAKEENVRDSAKNKYRAIFEMTESDLVEQRNWLEDKGIKNDIRKVLS